LLFLENDCFRYLFGFGGTCPLYTNRSYLRLSAIYLLDNLCNLDTISRFYENMSIILHLTHLHLHLKLWTTLKLLSGIFCRGNYSPDGSVPQRFSQDKQCTSRITNVSLFSNPVFGNHEHEVDAEEISSLLLARIPSRFLTILLFGKAIDENIYFFIVEAEPSLD
jgi:hypothetical protein